VLLAAWFHDAVYRGIAGQDEEESARLAEDRLEAAGLPEAEVAEVARLVRLTSITARSQGTTTAPSSATRTFPSSAGNLASMPGTWRTSARIMRTSATLTSLPEGAAVVRQLLELDPLFHTGRAKELWQDAAHRNLLGELA
jgi:predicted metal-dependent HD superfamily phosphohydrolase